MDIDSAKRADVHGRGMISPDGVGARRKSPRASVGAGCASVGGRSEASKGGRTSTGPAKHAAVLERRVLFSDDVEPVVAQPKKKLTNAEREEAARVEFTDKVREETGAILSPEWRVKWVSIGGANSQRKDRRYVAPDGSVYSGPAAVVQRIRSHGTKGLVAASAPAPAADAAAEDAEEDTDDEAVMPTQAAPPRDWDEEDLTPARRRSLGGFARGIVDTFASAFKSRGTVEDSAAKPSSGDDDAVADSEDDSPAAEGDEGDDELLAQAKVDLIEQVQERAGVKLSDAWRVRFETGGGMERGRKRKRFFSPEGNKYSSQSKVLDLVMRQLAKGDVDVPVVTCGEIPGWFSRWGSPRRRASAPAAASRFSPRRERNGAGPESPVFQPNVPSPLLSPAAKAAAAATEKVTSVAKKVTTPVAKKVTTPVAKKVTTPVAKKVTTPVAKKAATPTPAKKAPASDPAETTPAPARRSSPRTSADATAMAKTTPGSAAAAKKATTPRRTPRASTETSREATRSSPRAAAAAAAAVAAGVASVATTKAPSPVAASPPPLATRVSPRASSRTAPSTAPSVVAPPPERDSVKTLDQLRRKMEMKLDHELEDGWRVEWEPGANGREEKVYYDPAAPGKKLLGDAMALTHVKMRLAALAVQQRAAAEAAAKMAADAKGEERAAAEAYAAVAAKIAVSSDAATMVRLGAEMDAARDALRQKSEWAVFAAEQAASAAQKLPPAERAKLGSGSESVPALPAPEAATTPGTATKSTPGTATKTPVGATKEERARMELVERVYGETGVRLGPDWRVTYRPKSDGSFHRFIFSPGGKKFLSGTALVNHVKDFKARAMAVEGEAVKSPEQMERERIEDEEFSKEEATARRELLKQVFDETGVMLGANWRVSMERSWSAAKRRMVGRMRFFAPGPENKKFSSKADVVDFVERQVRRGKLKRHSAPKRPRGVSAEAASTRGAKAARSEDGSRKTSSAVAVARTPASREEAAVAELSDRVYAATGITLKPGYEVRWVRENSGKEYKRFYCPAGKRYSSPGELIAALKKQHEKEQAEGECERRNLAAEMDLAADDAPAKAAPRKVSNVARDRQRREGAGKTLALPAPPPTKPALKSALKKPTKALTASKSSSSSLAAATPALPRRDKRAPTPTATRAMTSAEKSSLAQVRDRVREELGVELNKGWSVVIASRKTGASSGTTDKYYIAPSVPKDAPEGFTTRVKFRSEAEVVNYARQLFGVPSSKKRSRAAKSAPASAAAAKTTKPNKKAKSSAGTSAAARAEEDEEGEDEMEDDADVAADDSDDDSESDESDDSESDSEGADAGEETYGVQVEGMLTVMDADKARRAFEKRVLTPAKARELEEHIESQLANPSMGFDVDVLQLEYQRVTGFEALTDDPMELREMLQKVVQREKEKASAAAGGDAAGMFSPETNAAVAATTGNDDGDGGREGGRPRRGEASKRAADVLRKVKQTRPGGDGGGEEGGEEASRDNRRMAAPRGVERPKEKETAKEEHRGMRVARTLGNVGLNDAKRTHAAWTEEEEEDEDDDEEEEVIEGTATETTENPAETTENRGESGLAVPGSQEEAVQKPTEEAAQKPTDGASESADTVAAVDESVAVTAVAPHARGVATRWNPTDASMVAQVKSALHTSTAPGGVRCREAERKRVVDIIQRSLKSGRSASVYVCGLPGTGKSLTVSEAEKVARSWGDGSALGGGSKRALARADRPRVAAVNCMALAEPRHVFARIIEELGGTPPSASSESGASGAAEAADVSQLPEVAALRALVVDRAGAGSGAGAGLRTSGVASAGSHGPMTVILLDEMDQLVSKAQGILYELFGLPTLAKSRCVVVGVANGINLVEVTLPRLAARGCEPAVVRFNAYDRDQLKLLLRQRLGSLPWTVFEDAGLELCSRKVAAATGDMRRALNICAAAVDLCAREANEAAAKTEDRETAGAGSAEGISPSRRRARVAASASLVKISHMARAISASFSSPVVDTMRGLPQHQQMVLCAAVRLFRDATRKEATLGVLNDTYTALCKEAGIRGLTPGEFSGVCTVLADQTLLRVGPGREDRQRKTSLAVHQDDVVFALQGVNFFRNLIGERGGARGGR